MIIRKAGSIAAYIQYKLRASSNFKVHSPFVYKLYSEVILKKGRKSDFSEIENIRSKLLRDKSLLETTDFGAAAINGSYKIRFRNTAEIMKHSSVSPKYGRLLYRLCSFAAPGQILEIGTAMGISSMYIAKAAPEAALITFEGCANIADKARQNFNSISLKHIKLVIGNFDNSLPKALEKLSKLDFVFIDGNHKYEPTINYFEQILPLLHAESLVVIDDIHWSQGMKQAWDTIRARESVSISIDLYRCGILIFRKDIEKQHFTLKF